MNPLQRANTDSSIPSSSSQQPRNEDAQSHTIDESVNSRLKNAFAPELAQHERRASLIDLVEDARQLPQGNQARAINTLRHAIESRLTPQDQAKLQRAFQKSTGTSRNIEILRRFIDQLPQEASERTAPSQVLQSPQRLPTPSGQMHRHGTTRNKLRQIRAQSSTTGRTPTASPSRGLPVSELPFEIKNDVVSQLPGKDKVNLSKVNGTFRKFMTESGHLAAAHYEREIETASTLAQLPDIAQRILAADNIHLSNKHKCLQHLSDNISRLSETAINKEDIDQLLDYYNAPLNEIADTHRNRLAGILLPSVSTVTCLLPEKHRTERFNRILDITQESSADGNDKTKVLTSLADHFPWLPNEHRSEGFNRILEITQESSADGNDKTKVLYTLAFLLEELPDEHRSEGLNRILDITQGASADGNDKAAVVATLASRLDILPEEHRSEGLNRLLDITQGSSADGDHKTAVLTTLAAKIDCLPTLQDRADAFKRISESVLGSKTDYADQHTILAALSGKSTEILIRLADDQPGAALEQQLNQQRDEQITAIDKLFERIPMDKRADVCTQTANQVSDLPPEGQLYVMIGTLDSIIQSIKDNSPGNYRTSLNILQDKLTDFEEEYELMPQVWDYYNEISKILNNYQVK